MTTAYLACSQHPRHSRLVGQALKFLPFGQLWPLRSPVSLTEILNACREAYHDENSELFVPWHRIINVSPVLPPPDASDDLCCLSWLSQQE